MKKEQVKHLIVEWGNLLDISPRKKNDIHEELVEYLNTYAQTSDVEKLINDGKKLGQDFQVSIEHISKHDKAV